MDVIVAVEGCMAAPGGGPVSLSLHVCTTRGHDIGLDVPADFAASTTTMRTRILDHARKMMTDMGIAGAATARYVLIGGPV